MAMRDLRELLVTCSNLERLSVGSIRDNFIPGGQCLVEPGMRLPRLKFLRIHGHMQLANYNLSGWEDCLVYDALEYLESMDSTFLLGRGDDSWRSPPSLEELRSLTLIDWPTSLSLDGNTVWTLINHLPKLESLCLWSKTESIFNSNILQPKGYALKTLKLHEEKNIYTPAVPYAPGEAQIRRLAITCPRLTTCALDMHVEQEWVSSPQKLLISLQCENLIQFVV